MKTNDYKTIQRLYLKLKKPRSFGYTVKTVSKLLGKI